MHDYHHVKKKRIRLGSTLAGPARTPAGISLITAYLTRHRSPSNQWDSGIDRRCSSSLTWSVLSSQALTLCDRSQGGFHSDGHATIGSNESCMIWGMPHLGTSVLVVFLGFTPVLNIALVPRETATLDFLVFLLIFPPVAVPSTRLPNSLPRMADGG